MIMQNMPEKDPNNFQYTTDPVRPVDSGFDKSKYMSTDTGYMLRPQLPTRPAPPPAQAGWEPWIAGNPGGDFGWSDPTKPYKPTPIDPGLGNREKVMSLINSSRYKAPVVAPRTKTFATRRPY